MLSVLKSLARRRGPGLEDGVLPQLLPGWGVRDAKVPGIGLYLRRLGGPRVLTARGHLPRIAGIAAIRGFCLSRRPVTRIELRVDGALVQVVTPVRVTPTDPTPLQKHVFNIWHDFSGYTPGLHRVTIRVPGLVGRIYARNRRVRVDAPSIEAGPSDAEIPHIPGDTRSADAIVTGLPSMLHRSQRAALPDPVRRILVVRADQLGDLVVSVPALQRLRELFPDARITGLVTADNVELAEATELFDETVVVRFADADRALATEEQDRLRTLFAERKFDVAIDLGEGARSRLLLLLSGASFLHGFRNGDHGWLSSWFEFNGRDPVNGMEIMQPSRKVLALVEALGTLRPTRPVYLPAVAGAERLSAFGLAPGETYIILHTGARLVPSRWPGFGRLAELLLERTSHRLVVFAHGGAWDLADPGGRVTVIDGKLPFADFDALLGQCVAFVGNDSGPKHLAALRGAKVVSLHMARLNWNEWGQEGDGLIVSRRVPCAGCNIGDHPEECGRDYACLRAITPEEVCDALLSLL